MLRVSGNEIKIHQATGFYRDVELQPYSQEDEVKDKERELSGVEKNGSDEDYTLLEVHTNLDLEGFEHKSPIDGDMTGIKLPYIVILDLESGQILSIRRNYKEGDQYFKKLQYFSHYKFLPGLGLYGYAGGKDSPNTFANILNSCFCA